jgi:ATP-dependent helicase/DNAse subunit B
MEFSEDLNATEWGSLLHSLFDQILKSYDQVGCSVRQIAADILRDNGRRLAETIQAFAIDDSLAVCLRPPLLADLIRTRLFKTVRSYWEEVLSGSVPDGRNVRTESRSEAEFPTLPGLSLSGQLDRLDERGDELVVLYYKSGREPEHLDEEIRLGFRLQPILYPWLLLRNNPSFEESSFSYVFLGGSGRPKEVAVPGTGNAEQWLALLSDILKRGVYLPASNEALEQLGVEKANACQYCECASLCRRFERGFRSRASSLLREHLEDRVRSLRGESGDSNAEW